MRRHLQVAFVIPVGDEAQSARALWAQMGAEERRVMARLAAELVLLAEATTSSRVVIAPAEILDSAGLPHAR